MMFVWWHVSLLSTLYFNIFLNMNSWKFFHRHSFQILCQYFSWLRNLCEPCRPEDCGVLCRCRSHAIGAGAGAEDSRHTLGTLQTLRHWLRPSEHQLHTVHLHLHLHITSCTALLKPIVHSAISCQDSGLCCRMAAVVNSLRRCLKLCSVGYTIRTCEEIMFRRDRFLTHLPSNCITANSI